MSFSTTQEAAAELNADKLKFGSLFGDAEKAAPLTSSEVLDVLQKHYQTLQAQELEGEVTETFQSTLGYLNAIGIGIKPSDAKELRWTIREKESTANTKRKLHPFEVAALINLAPEDFEQATALVRSLLDFESSDDKRFIEDILKEIQEKTSY